MKQKKFYKKPWFIIVSGLTLLIGGGITYAALTREDESPYETAQAVRTDLVGEVSVTGQVKPVDQVDLAFSVGGKVAVVYVSVGQQVLPDQVLATLNTREVASQLSSSQANLANARATLEQQQIALELEQVKLDQLKLGTRPEELRLAETRVANAQRSVQDSQSILNSVTNQATQDLDSLYLSVPDIINDAYTKADNAVHQLADPMFSKEYVYRGELNFIVQTVSLKTKAEQTRNQAIDALDDLQAELATMPTSADYVKLDKAITSAITTMQVVQTFLLAMTDALNDTTQLSTDLLSSYKTNINTGRTNVVSSITALNSQKFKISSQMTNNQNAISNARSSLSKAENDVLVAQDELRIKQAGTQPEEIKAQEVRVKQQQATVSSQLARVRQAVADVEGVAADLANLSLKSSFGGTVTKSDVKVGQIVAANTPLISIITDSALEIVANVPEADIAKVKISDDVHLTLDAYSDDVLFNAKVVKIDPAETVIDGVSTYKITMHFDQIDARVKPGMTANLDIISAKRDQVVAVPQRAVFTQDNIKYVRVLENGIAVERVVKVGLISSDGQVEILEGVNEGEVVVTFIRQ